MPKPPRDLTDQSVVRSLQEFTEDLAGDGPRDVDDYETAVAALDALLAHVSDQGVEELLRTQEQALATGRNLLDGLARDPATADAVGAILETPPEDNRLVTDSLYVSVAVVAAALTWLQTKFDLQVRRKNGRTDVELRVEKQPASDSLLKQVATALWSMLTKGGGPDQ
ncbi:hypothetical protein [Streptomyces sp. Ag109_G2-15]|uniref:hypothetical protein n=1 Tax=Streptomyces sp. Ag109_G2-15 TaxID=1938850 RepID=UPI000BCFA5FB|nr:hypothetical protein [Streptomyces sp. Ag109_G2-15]SOD86637.1 hypothetical protein SAMN06272765_4104 [Streptomyces sp. Ag109_G2-15]